MKENGPSTMKIDEDGAIKPMKITYKIKFFSITRPPAIYVDRLPTIEELKYHPLRQDGESIWIWRLLDGNIDDDCEPMTRIYFVGEVMDGSHPRYRKEGSVPKYGACIYIEKRDRF